MTEEIYWFLNECRSEYLHDTEETYQAWGRHGDPLRPRAHRLLMRYEKAKLKTGLTWAILEESYRVVLRLMQQHKLAYRETYWYIRGPELQVNGIGSRPRNVVVGKASIQTQK